LDIAARCVTRYLSGVHAVSVVLVIALLLLLLPPPARGEPWSDARIARLPDDAFAVVEVAPDGRPLRHLPHHDETGAVDLPHLRAALGRFSQVRWLDPATALAARRHLESHWQELKANR
jgi:hypothetical protein